MIPHVSLFLSFEHTSKTKTGTVKFKSEKDASEAMETYGKEPVENLGKLWKKGPVATFNEKPVELIFRFATTGVSFSFSLFCNFFGTKNQTSKQDVKDPMVSGRDSKYYKRLAITRRSKGIKKPRRGFDLGPSKKDKGGKAEGAPKAEGPAKVEDTKMEAAAAPPPSEGKKEEMTG